MFGKLGEKMRRKFNQRGAIGTILLGLAAAGMATWGISFLVTGSNEAILGILRTIGLFIDTQVYSVSSFAYSIFYEVAFDSLLSSLNLTSEAQRLYTLLGIFMLFRLAFAFIKYIINPDGMEKGTSKLLTNLAVSLALIVSVPWIFNRAFALQNYIMDSNVIGNLIMGMDNDKFDKDEGNYKNGSFNAASYGQAISFLTFGAFYSPNLSITQLSPCGNILYYYSDNLKIAPDGKSLNEEEGENGELLNKDEAKIAKCINALNDISKSPNGGEGNVSSVEIGTRFYISSQRYNFGLLTDWNVLSATYGNQHVITYLPIVSTIAGGFLALLFLNFTFDVAIRNVKLCFLQIIAPIPIILNIEPGDSKGDKKSLNWWAKESLKTYVDLFIRVATVYFGVFLINIISGHLDNSVWFRVFTIFGILLFVKQIPDMIGKAFGIEVKGQFSLNPLKRIGDNRITSMALGGVAGLATGALGGGFAAYRGARSAGAGRGEALRRAITGGADTAVHGLTGGAKKGAKSIHDITSNTRENMARSGRIASSNVGTTLGGRLSAGAAMAMGVKTKSQRMEDQAIALEKTGKDLSAVKSMMNGDKTAVSKSVRMGAGSMQFGSADEAMDFLNRNSQLTDSDRKKVMAAAKSFEEVERLKSVPVTVNKTKYANYAEAEMALRHGSMPKDRKSDIEKVLRSIDQQIAVTSSAQNVMLDGQEFSNVKDANDYLERLRSSGASETVLKNAEDQVGMLQAQRWADALAEARTTGVDNFYSSVANEYRSRRAANEEVYEQYVVDPATGKSITDIDSWSSFKAASGAGNMGAGTQRRAASQAIIDEKAAQAKHGK